MVYSCFKKSYQISKLWVIATESPPYDIDFAIMQQRRKN